MKPGTPVAAFVQFNFGTPPHALVRFPDPAPRKFGNPKTY